MCAVGSTHEEVPSFQGQPLRLRLRPGSIKPNLRQRSPPQFRFRAGGLQEVGYALQVGSIHVAADVRQGQAKRRAPAGNRRTRGRGPASVGCCQDLSRDQARSAAGSPWSTRAAVEGGLQPGLFAAVIAPAAVGILGAPEDVQTHSQIGVSHENRSAQSALSVRSKEGSGTIPDFRGTAVLAARRFIWAPQWFILDSVRETTEDRLGESTLASVCVPAGLGPAHDAGVHAAWRPRR